MIHVNLQDSKTLTLNRAVAAAVNAIRSRSSDARHPERGRPFNCYVCGRRHYGLQCEPVYAKDKGGAEMTGAKTRKGILGAAMFRRKRFLPHHGHKLLQLVQRTQELYTQYAQYLTDPEEIMKEARKQARRELKLERGIRAKNRRRTQQDSRRINARLVKPGYRSAFVRLQEVSVETRNKRQAKQRAAEKRNGDAIQNRIS